MDTTWWVVWLYFGVGKRRLDVIRVRLDVRMTGDGLVCRLQTLFGRSSGGVSIDLLASIV